MLIFVLIPWVPEAIVRPRNGARRWISLYFTDFQPSELTKIAYICALASYLRFRRNYRTFFGLFLPLALTFVPMVLILVEPDLGSAMLFLPTLFAMLIAAGAKIWHLV
jgi:rod shape determining protein RodA